MRGAVTVTAWHHGAMKHQPQHEPASGPVRRPTGLIVLWCVLVFPVLLTVVIAVGSAASNASGLFGDHYVVYASVAIGLLSAAIATTVAAARARRRGPRRAFTAATVILLSVLAAPIVAGLAMAAADEWCEGQPGGRGGTEFRTESDIPPVCR